MTPLEHLLLARSVRHGDFVLASGQHSSYYIDCRLTTMSAAEPVLDAFSVRKGAKGHGTRRLIEGNFAPGWSVVIVEDVITSGSSALQAIQAVTTEGARVAGVLAVVDREQGGRAALEAAGYPVQVLTTASALGLRERG